MHQKTSQDISESSDHSTNRLLSLAKAIATWIGTHPLYISYLVFFSPYILKLLCFLSPLLILLLATTLCAFSATASTSSSFLRVKCNETQENASTTRLEAEAYKIIFDTFHDSVTSLADESDEVEAYKQINLEALAPEIVKSLCSYTPQHDHDPALHEIVAKTATCAEDKVLNQALTTTPKSASKASPIESITSTDLHKTSNLSSIGSMRMEKDADAGVQAVRGATQQPRRWRRRGWDGHAVGDV